jgi:hypothetical protein
VVVLPSLDAPAGDPVDRLTARLATLTRERTQRVDELRAMPSAQRQALVRERVSDTAPNTIAMVNTPVSARAFPRGMSE